MAHRTACVSTASGFSVCERQKSSHCIQNTAASGFACASSAGLLMDRLIEADRRVAHRAIEYAACETSFGYFLINLFILSGRVFIHKCQILIIKHLFFIF